MVDDGSKKVRSVPTLYHGSAPIFGHRDLDRVRERLGHTVETVRRADEVPAYLITACRFKGNYGLYAQGVFNRTAMRRDLERRGVEFSSDSYVRLTDRGTWESDGWQEFHAQFVVTGGPYSREPSEVVRRTVAETVFAFGVLRVGNVTSQELTLLVPALHAATRATSRDPDALVEALNDLPNSPETG